MMWMYFLLLRTRLVKRLVSSHVALGNSRASHLGMTCSLLGLESFLPQNVQVGYLGMEKKKERPRRVFRLSFELGIIGV